MKLYDAVAASIVLLALIIPACRDDDFDPCENQDYFERHEYECLKKISEKDKY